MTYTFVFEPEFARIVPAILIDSRADIPVIKNKIGAEIKAYCDFKISLLGTNTITYKIETNLGVLAGFFSVTVNTDNQTATLLMEQVRPAFKGFEEIQTQIGNFIQGQTWKQDYLF